MQEELGVEVAVGEAVTFAFHRDERRVVLLLFYRSRIVSGTPHGREGQQVGWFTPNELARLATPPADAGLVAALIGGTGRGKRGE